MHVVVAGSGPDLLLLHGFPDSSRLWREVIPGLVAAGFRVIAPDQRGFGLTDAPTDVAAYTIERIVADAVAVLDALGIARAGLIAHDWGAVIGWRLVADHPDRFSRYLALAVGQPNALTSAGLRQIARSWYVLFFQLRGIAEAAVRARNFAMLGWMTGHEPEIATWRRDLARPGRLTAALSWYRANFWHLVRSRFPVARVPVLGLIGSADVALTEAQMVNSGPFVDAPFQAVIIEGAGHWLPLHHANDIVRHAVAFLAPK